MHKDDMLAYRVYQDDERRDWVAEVTQYNADLYPTPIKGLSSRGITAPGALMALTRFVTKVANG